MIKNDGSIMFARHERVTRGTTKTILLDENKLLFYHFGDKVVGCLEFLNFGSIYMFTFSVA